MARRNKKKRRRKHDSIISPGPLAGLLSVGVVLCFMYICLVERCDAIGKEIKELELRKAAAEKQHAIERYKWSRLRALPSVEQALTHHGIAMDWPRQDQIVRLRDVQLADADLVTDLESASQFARIDRAVSDDR